MHVRKGETIFYKDTTGNMMFVILEGQVGVFDGEKPIATLTAGDMFGEMALINNAPRSATAIAVTDTNLFTLSEEIFQRLLTKRVAVRILLNIVATLSKRLRETDRKPQGNRNARRLRKHGP